MSSRAWGWCIAMAGVWALIIGCLMISLGGTWSIGYGLAVIGAFTAATGGAVIAEPRPERAQDDAEAYENRWSDWSPECPVHGRYLCSWRTAQCPDERRKSNGA